MTPDGFGSSRTPVREALGAALRQDGLVETGARGFNAA